LSVLGKEDEAFFCLKALQRLSNDAFPPAQFIHRYALCVSLFRSLLPQLFVHLQSLFVDTSLWLPSWLQFLLSVELPLPALLRLWDFYFSDDECVQMHMFVCLGMLQVGVQAALAVRVLLRAERVAAAPSRCVAGCAGEAAGLERPQRRVLSSHVSARLRFCCCCFASLVTGFVCRS